MFDLVRRQFGLPRKTPEAAKEDGLKKRSSMVIRLQHQCARITVDDKAKTTKVPGHPD